MNSIFISYIVPCYNIERQLPRCIESLEKQNVENHDVEFILVNDGSKDGTLHLIEQFAERDRRVVVINQENQGVSAARNNALSKAKGEYVFFLDGDDFMTDDASQQMYDACKETSPDILLMNNYQVKEEHPELFSKWIDYSKYIEIGTYTRDSFVAKTKRIPVSFKLYKLNFLQENEIVFDSHLQVGEVYTFFIHCLVRAYTIAVSYAPVMCYLKRSGQSATTNINYDRDKTALNTLHTVLGYVDSYQPELRKMRAFEEPLFSMITSFCLIKYVGRMKYTKQLGELIHYMKKDSEYHKLLNYMTGRRGVYNRDTLIALAVRFLPPRSCFNLLRCFYRYNMKNKG